MIIFGVDLSCPLIQWLFLFAAVGVLTALSLLRLYAFLTCGKCSSRASMRGKTVIVTGSNSGIGKETARELAARGARVIMACRNVNTANVARDDIVSTSKNNDVIVMKLDLSSQKSIREFAAEFLKNENRLDVLIHNAGTAESKKQVTEDGLEMTMATNHFGPFLLTHLLIDVLKRSAPSRVVIVASELYRLASVNFNNVNPINTFPIYLYYVSKYANIYFTKELSRRLEGTGVTANCLHPGMINSGIWRNVPVPLSWGMNLIVKLFFKSPVQGAQTTLYLAVSEDVADVSGKYFMDCKERGLSTSASDPARATKYWELTEQVVKLRPDEPRI